jgi:hypothetical protein
MAKGLNQAQGAPKDNLRSDDAGTGHSRRFSWAADIDGGGAIWRHGAVAARL